jgi:hypothetical protein
MIAKIDDHKIKYQPNIEMLKPVIKKKKNLLDLFYETIFSEYEKK